MGIAVVEAALLNLFQRDPTCDATLAANLPGTVTSTGTALVGVGTSFTQLLKGSYIGLPVCGYQKVTAIADDTHCSIENPYDYDIADEIIRQTQIKKGVPAMAPLTEVGQVMKIHCSSTHEAPGDTTYIVNAAMVFLVIFMFVEPDEDLAEERKAAFDSMIRNLLDNNLTIAGTVQGTTVLTVTMFMEAPFNNDYHIGLVPISCIRREARGQR